MLSDIAKLKSFNRFQAYLDPNAPPPQPQPDPIKMQEVQAKQMVAQATVMGAQTDQYKEQRLAVHDQDKIALQKQQLMLQSNEKARTAQGRTRTRRTALSTTTEQLQLDKAKTVLDAHNQSEDRALTAHDNHQNGSAAGS
jgi:outer membrane biosynthesis protein TonB